MNTWPNAVLTNKGRALMAKLTQGNTLNITKAYTGAGFVDPELLDQQLAVANKKQTLAFHPASYPESGKCAITVALSNEGLSTGYTAKQVGIYAMDPRDGEILLLIAQAADAESGTIVPSETEIPGFSSDWTFYLQYGQADGVNVTVDPAGAVSRQEMEEYVADNAAPTEHSHSYTSFVRKTAKMPTSLAWRTIAFGNGIFVALAYNSNTTAYSTDGITWTEGWSNNSIQARCVTYGNGKFVVVCNDAKIFFSTDGITWKKATVPSTTSDHFSSVAYGNGMFVATSANGSKVCYSTDGENWNETTLSVTLTSSVVGYGNGKFVLLSNRNCAFYSTDGITWTETTIVNSATGWNSITYGDGKFVAIAKNSSGGTKAAYSTDGITWKEATLPESNYWLGVTYGNGKFVVVANSNTTAGGTYTAAYSMDGITWTKTTFPESLAWYDVTYATDKFVAVATNSDVVAYSTDGITWKTEESYLKQDNEVVVPEHIGAAPAYSYGTEDLIAGESALETGKLYFVYE